MFGVVWGMKMAKTYRSSSATLTGTPLLLTESKAEFDRIRDALHDEIKPRGILEQMYVEDIAYLSWEVSRLRRSKTAIINLAFRAALKALITQLLREPGQLVYLLGDRPDELARDWFSDPHVKNRSQTCSGNLNWMRVPLKRRPFDNRPMTLNESTD